MVMIFRRGAEEGAYVCNVIAQKRGTHWILGDVGRRGNGETLILFFIGRKDLDRDGFSSHALSHDASMPWLHPFEIES